MLSYVAVPYAIFELLRGRHSLGMRTLAGHGNADFVRKAPLLAILLFRAIGVLSVVDVIDRGWSVGGSAAGSGSWIKRSGYAEKFIEV